MRAYVLLIPWLLAACRLPASSTAQAEEAAHYPETDSRVLSSQPRGFTETALVEEAAPPAAAPPEEPRVRDLDVPGFYPAVLHVPRPGGRKPLVVGAHGAWDRADSFCGLLQRIVEDRAFVMCPRGKRTDARTPHESASYFFPTHLVLEAEVLAAVVAIEREYGERIDVSRAVYAGFSQGAIMGAAFLVRNPAKFPRAMLIEGAYGYGLWSNDMGARYRRNGGERVLFVCGGWYCADQARTSAFTIEGPRAKTNVVRGAGGHTYGGDVARAAAEAFPWLIAGDPRFAGP